MKTKRNTIQKFMKVCKKSFAENKIFNTFMLLILLGMLVLLIMDPIVLSIEEGNSIRGDSSYLLSFYEDDYARYYIRDPFDTTVKYLNNDSEDISSAMINGHITFADLEEYDIEYYVKPKDGSGMYRANSRRFNWFSAF